MKGTWPSSTAETDRARRHAHVSHVEHEKPNRMGISTFCMLSGKLPLSGSIVRHGAGSLCRRASKLAAHVTRLAAHSFTFPKGIRALVTERSTFPQRVTKLCTRSASLRTLARKLPRSGSIVRHLAGKLPEHFPRLAVRFSTFPKDVGTLALPRATLIHVMTKHHTRVPKLPALAET
jgi:hypothetical protein